MILRLLSALARYALRRPASVVLAVTVPSLLLSLYAATVPVDLSFGGMMDRDHPEVARYFEASRRYGLGGWVPILLEGSVEARLDEAVTALERRLAREPRVRSVAGELPVGWLRERAPWWVEPDVFEAWLALAQDPGDPVAADRVAAGLDTVVDRFDTRRVEGARLLVATLAEDPFEVALDDDGFARLREIVRETVAPCDVTARFAGMAAIVTQEQEATLARMRWLAPVSLVLVLLVLRLVVSQWRWLLALALPLLLAAGATLGVVGLFAGRLTLMESVFGVLIFGLGVDFGIHWVLRVREERSAGQPVETSVERAVAGTGRGIVAGAVTSGGAFLLLTLAPEPVFRQLGLSGGIGLLACLVLLLTLLPAQQVWLSRGKVRTDRSLRVLGLDRLAASAVRRPRRVLAVAAVVFAASASMFSSFRYETDLERVFSREIDAVATARRIHERFGIDPRPWIVSSDGRTEAAEIAERFAAQPLFVRVDSAAFLFRPDARERAARLAALPDALASAPGPLGVLGRARALGPPDDEALPPALRERFQGPDGEWLVYAFAAEPGLDSAKAAEERRVAQAIAPDATSMVSVFEALIGTDRPWMPRLSAGVLAFVALIVCLDLRSPRHALLALTPVVFGGVVGLGLLNALGFAFNTVTLVGIPLLLGLGVDDGIHVAHRMQEQPERTLEEVVHSVGPAVAMTTLTTCASVAALLFTRHPGIESLAWLLLSGLPLCLLATVWVLPALAVVLGLAGPAATGNPGRRP